MIKSSSDSVKLITQPVMIPLRISGNTVLKRPHRLASQVHRRLVNIHIKLVQLGNHIQNHIGQTKGHMGNQQGTKAQHIAAVHQSPAKTNSSIIEMPVTISGFIMGTLVSSISERL